MYMYAKIAVDFETKNKTQTHNYIKMFITRLLQAIGYTQKHFICGNPDESNVCPIHWSQVFLIWKWRCSWSSADRQCSDYIWVINNFVAYWGATYKSRFDGISVCRIAKFGNSCECCQYYYIHRHGLISVISDIYIISVILQTYAPPPGKIWEWDREQELQKILLE